MKNCKLFASYLTVFCLVLALAGCGTPKDANIDTTVTATQQSAAAESAANAARDQSAKTPLRVGMMSDLCAIPFMVAQTQGYFADNVEITVYMSATDRDSALFSGNLEGTSSDVLAAVFAQNGEYPVYITSATYGDFGLVAGKDKGVATAQDLAGKEIGLSTNTIIEYVTDCILTDMGQDPNGVEKVTVPKIPSRLELLEAGQIDAIAAPEPFVTAAKQSGGVVIGTASQLGIVPSVMLFTQDTVDNRQEELKEFYAAVDKAIAYMASTPKEEYMPAVIQALGLPPAAMETTLPTYQNASLPEREQVERAAQWLVEKKLVETLYTYEQLTRDVL